MISSLIISFSPTRRKIAVSLIIFLIFRNRSCIRRNNRVKVGIFIDIEFISDSNLGRTMVDRILLELNE
jgi:hypothetical protein